MVPDAPESRTPGAARKGFALLVVIWGLGAIALLVTSFLTTGRLRLQTAFNLAVAAQAQSIAAAAADLAILSLAGERVGKNGASPGPRKRVSTMARPVTAPSKTPPWPSPSKTRAARSISTTRRKTLLQDVLVGLLGLPSGASGRYRARHRHFPHAARERRAGAAGGGRQAVRAQTGGRSRPRWNSTRSPA